MSVRRTDRAARWPKTNSPQRICQEHEVQIPSPQPKNDRFRPVVFLSKSQTWYIIDARVRRISSALWAVSHHASACIFLRLDDIQHSVLVICNALHWLYTRLWRDEAREFKSRKHSPENIFFIVPIHVMHPIWMSTPKTRGSKASGIFVPIFKVQF